MRLPENCSDLSQGSLPLSFEDAGLATWLAWYMLGLGVLCILMHHRLVSEETLFGGREGVAAPDYIAVGQ